jgi:tRNA (cytidine/uridine-2'-O-)-methyltransferase
MRFNIALVEPEIPQNTGSIGRLCVATNSCLHLVEPLGFDISEKAVRRSGLDYWKYVDLVTHRNYSEFRSSLPDSKKLWWFTKFAECSIFDASFAEGDYLIFGKETKGLPESVHKEEPKEQLLRIPMFSDKIRSLNLANAASIAVYEAIRQTMKK